MSAAEWVLAAAGIAVIVFGLVLVLRRNAKDFRMQR